MDKNAWKEDLQLVVHDFSLTLEEPMHLLSVKGKLKSANEIVETLLKCLPGRYDGKSNVLEFIAQVQECAQAHEIDFDDTLGAMPLVMPLVGPIATNRHLELILRCSFKRLSTRREISALISTGSRQSLIGRQLVGLLQGVAIQREVALQLVNSVNNYSSELCAVCAIYQLLCHTTRSGGWHCAGHCLFGQGEQKRNSGCSASFHINGWSCSRAGQPGRGAIDAASR